MQGADTRINRRSCGPDHKRPCMLEREGGGCVGNVAMGVVEVLVLCGSCRTIELSEQTQPTTHSHPVA